jgi:putative aminopeptidase FrvX
VIPPLLDELLRAVGPTGFEDDVASIVRREAADFAEVGRDVLGSTTAVVRGTPGGRLLAILAHCDEVGAMVSHVDDGGFLALHRLGDWSPETLVDQRVQVRSRAGTLPGVVGRRTAKGRVGWGDLYVDLGVPGRDEARELVAAGDPVVVTGAPLELAGGRIASKSCDNRTGLYAGIEALRALAAPAPAWDVALVATVQEEGTYAGASTTVSRLAPDAVLVLDVTWATDTPDADPRPHGEHPLGSGPAILRGPTVHPALHDALAGHAHRLGMPWTVEVAGRSLTDADAAYLAGGGFPTCVVSIPMRRYHSACETVQLSDVEETRRLVEALVRGLVLELDLAR